MQRFGHLAAACAVSALVATACGCSLAKRPAQRMIATFSTNVMEAMTSHPDPQTAREAAPAFLVMIDGMIRSAPDDAGLLLSGARAYSLFAGGFIDEQEPSRSILLHAQAKDYALRALRLSEGGAAALAGGFDAFEAYLDRASQADVPLLYTAATAWLGWITAEGSQNARADLPYVRILLERCLALDDTCDGGGAHVFFGVYYAVQPPGFGGDLEKSRAHFDRAFAINGGTNLMHKVLFARYYARQAFDRDLFVTTLEQVLAAPDSGDPRYRLSNELARQRAKKLIGLADSYF